MSAPLPRHCYLAGMPRGSTWADLQPRLKRRLECMRDRRDHWSYDTNLHLALAEAVQDAEAALRKETA